MKKVVPLLAVLVTGAAFAQRFQRHVPLEGFSDLTLSVNSSGQVIYEAEDGQTGYAYEHSVIRSEKFNDDIEEFVTAWIGTIFKAMKSTQPDPNVEPISCHKDLPNIRDVLRRYDVNYKCRQEEEVDASICKRVTHLVSMLDANCDYRHRLLPD